MPASRLPSHPNVEHLRNQAKAFLRAYAASDPEAITRVRAGHPRFRDASDATILSAALPLTEIQLVVAREYGFENWIRMKEHVDAAPAGQVSDEVAFTPLWTSDTSCMQILYFCFEFECPFDAVCIHVRTLASPCGVTRWPSARRVKGEFFIETSPRTRQMRVTLAAGPMDADGYAKGACRSWDESYEVDRDGLAREALVQVLLTGPAAAAVGEPFPLLSLAHLEGAQSTDRWSLVVEPM